MEFDSCYFTVTNGDESFDVKVLKPSDTSRQLHCELVGPEGFLGHAITALKAWETLSKKYPDSYIEVHGVFPEPEPL